MPFIPDENGYLRVETHRSGPFEFQVGLDFERLRIPKIRAEEAYARFASMPFVGEVSSQLEKMTLVTSVYSTNTIEGGELSEIETEEAMGMSPDVVKGESERRVVNLREAYRFAETFPSFIKRDFSDERKEKAKEQGWLRVTILEEMITDLHMEIIKDLSHPDNIPGQYRNNPKHRKTQVGDNDHGGKYTPPKCLDDIKLLIGAFVDWANCDKVMSLPPLYRAPLLHYYFELIHPFWDGNGRTGRVLEAFIAQASGYKYAPYAISKYYLDNIDAYFSLFNACRKSASKGEESPNTPFVEFYLKGLLSTINRLHDRSNQIISLMLFNSQVHSLFSQKKINARQYTIVNQISSSSSVMDLDELKLQPWYLSLYTKLTDRTRKRDLEKLQSVGLVENIEGKRVKISYASPGIKLSEYPITSE